MLVVEYMIEMENHEYKGDPKKDWHDEPAYDKLVPAEKAMAAEEHLAAVPKNENYYRILEQAWEKGG